MFLYGRINKANTKRTSIKRFQFKHIIHSFGHNRGTSSNITKRKAREVIQFNCRYGGFYSKLLLHSFNENIGDMLFEGKIKCACRHLVMVDAMGMAKMRVK